VRAIVFYLTTLTLAVPLFVVMLVIQPFVLLFDKQRRRAQHLVNKVSSLPPFGCKSSKFLGTCERASYSYLD